MDESRLVAEAEVYLCFARAFSPPRDPSACAGLAGAFPQDLAGAFLDSGVGHEPVWKALAGVAAEPVTAEDAYQAYSSLFLVPPPAAPLNLGIYVDGRRAGAAIADLDACCRHLGVEPAIKDQPDHLSIVLELVALLRVRELEALRGVDHQGAAESRRMSFYLMEKYLLPALPRIVESAHLACGERGISFIYARLAALLLERLALEAPPGRTAKAS